MLRIKELTKAFGDKTVFDGFSAHFPKGSRTLIMGQSGKGKTTLLRIIAKLESADSGEIEIPDGAEIAMMFQEPRLFMWMNVLDNVKAVLPNPESQKAELLLSELGLGDEIKSMPSQLSGGMQRRVSLARTLLYPADLYLFDEPFAGLDHDMAKKTADIIFKHTKDKTVVIVSHDRSMLPNDIDTLII